MLVVMTGFAVGNVFSQEQFSFSRLEYSGIEAVEKNHESLLIDSLEFTISIGNYGSSIYKKTHTLIYQRVNDDFSPKLHVWYHLEPSTRELVGITYNWDFYNPGFNPDKNRDLIIATNAREEEYREKYEGINEQLQELFGPPNYINSISDNEYSFNEMQYWESDNQFIYSRMRFQRTLTESPFIGLANNHFVVQMVLSYK